MAWRWKVNAKELLRIAAAGLGCEGRSRHWVYGSCNPLKWPCRAWVQLNPCPVHHTAAAARRNKPH